MGCWVAGVFLFHFWRKTRDRLLALFGCAFWILCATRLMSAWAADSNEFKVQIYLMRLFAFALILLALVDKNRPR